MHSHRRTAGDRIEEATYKRRLFNQKCFLDGAVQIANETVGSLSKRSDMDLRRFAQELRIRYQNVATSEDCFQLLSDSAGGRGACDSSHTWNDALRDASSGGTYRWSWSGM